MTWPLAIVFTVVIKDCSFLFYQLTIFHAYLMQQQNSNTKTAVAKCLQLPKRHVDKFKNDTKSPHTSSTVQYVLQTFEYFLLNTKSTKCHCPKEGGKQANNKKSARDVSPYDRQQVGCKILSTITTTTTKRSVLLFVSSVFVGLTLQHFSSSRQRFFHFSIS